MGSTLLKDIAKGIKIELPNEYIYKESLESIIEAVADELAIDTYYNLEPCMCINMEKYSNNVILCIGESLQSIVRHSNEIYDYTTEISDDGGIELRCNGEVITCTSIINHKISNDIYTFHKTLVCRNYDGVICAVRLVLEDMFNDISSHLITYLKRYKLFMITQITNEFSWSDIYLGFQSDDCRHYRTGSMRQDIFMSAVDKELNRIIRGYENAT